MQDMKKQTSIQKAQINEAFEKMKAKGKIDPNQLAKMGFDVKPKQESEQDISYIPKKDIRNRVNLSKLKDPYMPTGGKIGTGGHSRQISNTEFRASGNKSARDKSNNTNLRGSNLGSMKHQSTKEIYNQATRTQ